MVGRELSKESPSYTAYVRPLPDIADLARSWSELEARGTGSMFTSWTWIEAWLLNLAPQPACRLLEVVSGDQTVALGIIVFTARRHHGLSRRSIQLHATGDPDRDSVCIEHNGLICSTPLPEAAYDAVLSALLSLPDEWDELELPGLAASAGWISAARRSGLLIDVQTRPTPQIDFTQIPPSASISSIAADSRSRNALRRALRIYSSRLGPTTICEPRTLDEALEFFASMRDLHQAYWITRGERGAFASRHIVHFHEQLIRRGFDRGETRLLRTLAGQRVIGYLYLLVYQNVACYYQSGYDYHALPSGNQPGWFCMQLAMEHLRSQGIRMFDLLAGRHQYKRRLANQITPMYWLRCVRPRLRFRLDHLLTQTVRAAKRLLPQEST